MRSPAVHDGGGARHGVVAAGHPLTAEAGVRALHEGGNAVDAALAAMLTSFVAEPLLTGLGAGGYMVVADGDERAVLDFFVESPGPRPDGAAELEAVDVSFGDARQVFHFGVASCGVYGAPAGVCAASRRWGTLPLEQLVAPVAELADAGVPLNAQQAYVARILTDLLRSSVGCAALWAPGGELLREGSVLRNPDLGESLRRLGHDGAEPFYSGDIAAAVAETMQRGGGWLSAAQLAAYSPCEREPLTLAYRDRTVLTNPPPSAGGLLLAYSLKLLDGGAAPPSLRALLRAMRAAQEERTPRFTEGLGSEAFVAEFVSSRLGATTHISVLDSDGMACAVTSTNGEGSAVIVPGTGIHMNNVMGEQDLNPSGFHLHPAGRRMPSMMAPTLVLGDGAVQLVLGSAGSNRIRSALLQTIVGVVDHGLDVAAAVCAPRAHYEDGIVYHEPGLDADALALAGTELVRFHERNLFFGGVQAVQRRADGSMRGAGDPRRGGVALSA
ncbi:MAG: gamma-glutamyltransferase family protein [Solirubrobacteraceae bacterium]